MTRIPRLALAALALCASASQAQQFGTYVGTTSQGETFEIRVDDNGFGDPVLASATVFWSATCTKSGPGRFTAWGIGVSEAIVARKVTLEARYNQLYEKFDLKFNAAGNRVTGKFQGKTSEFEDIANSTRSVELCDSGTLDVSADLQVPSAVRTPAAVLPTGTAMRLSR
jgi:hypothetical protein